MSVTAKLMSLHIAPRKVRLVADLIRGKGVKEARAILNFTVKRAAFPLLKLLNSATSNAKNNQALDETNLFISKIIVDEGRKQKRFMPRARGQASEIQKKTSHIVIVLDEIKEAAGKIAKGKKEMVGKKKEGRFGKKSELEKPKFKTEFRGPKPKIEKVVKKIFRRKAF